MTDYSFSWSVLLQYRDLLWQGLLITLQLSVLGFVLSTALGIIVGLCRLARNRLIRSIATAYVEFFRNVPLIVQIFFFYFGLGMDSFGAGLLALVVYSAAFIGEIVRSGVDSIPRTQFEAAHASGLSPVTAYRHVILPQAIAIVIPPLSTEATNLIKNTAIALTVGVQELTFMTQEIESITFRGLEAATAATAIYVVINICVLAVTSLAERHLKVERQVM